VTTCSPSWCRRGYRQRTSSRQGLGGQHRPCYRSSRHHRRPRPCPSVTSPRSPRRRRRSGKRSAHSWLWAARSPELLESSRAPSPLVTTPGLRTNTDSDPHESAEDGRLPRSAACDHDTRSHPELWLGSVHGGGWQGVEELHRLLARRGGGLGDHSAVGTRASVGRHRTKGSR
jgi:hypothetical protein